MWSVEKLCGLLECGHGHYDTLAINCLTPSKYGGRRMPMDGPKPTVAFTVRIPEDLYARIKSDADAAGQKLVAWFIRAALARLDRGQINSSGDNNA